MGIDALIPNFHTVILTTDTLFILGEVHFMKGSVFKNLTSQKI